MANLPKIKLVKEKTAVYYDGRKKINSPEILYKVGKQILRDYIEEDREAIVASASKIMLLHNHPSGDPHPSQDDIMITKRLVEVGKIVDIEVLDHLVVGNDNSYSFRESGNLE